MRARTALAVLALVAGPSLAACGGSSDETGSAAGSDSSSESSASPSESSGSSEEPATEEPEADDAPGPDDFEALLRALESAQPALRSSQDARQLNARADVPDSVEFGSFDKQSQEICLQDDDSGAVVDFTAANTLTVVMGQGSCDDLDELVTATPDPDDPDQLTYDGDEEIGATAQEFFDRIDG